MTTTRTIAIVEDEPAIRENYAEVFRAQGYQVDLYETRDVALSAFTKKLPDLALLDIGLKNDIDGGFELCRNLRQLSDSLPIIFLTARDSDLDTISGLRLGADDYLTKDISIENICARISAFFRRLDLSQQSNEPETEIKSGPLTLNKNRFTIQWHEQYIDLTLTEFWLIYTLVLHPGHVKNRNQLMDEAKIYVDDATITSHIKRIRNKFIAIDKDFNCIDTVYGIGYRWNEQKS
ncbi:Two-component transcriptional response regulator, LuxR family [hydrothermal vent metagenome]|uniref:Two-component transcriptional response regulator, LuxR family n=1 Tax=hydrothermal vent metagenome TaxID=652676 RepID=A0A3B1B3G4_9ZZZZ